MQYNKLRTNKLTQISNRKVIQNIELMKREHIFAQKSYSIQGNILKQA